MSTKEHYSSGEENEKEYQEDTREHQYGDSKHIKDQNSDEERLSQYDHKDDEGNNNKVSAQEDDDDDDGDYDPSGMEDNGMDDDPADFEKNDNDLSDEVDKTGDKVNMSDIFGSDNEESSNDEQSKTQPNKPKESQKEFYSDDEESHPDEEEEEEGSVQIKVRTSLSDEGETNSQDGENRTDASSPALTSQHQALQEILIEAEMPRVRPDMVMASASTYNKKESLTQPITPTTPTQHQNEIHFVKLPNFLSVEPKTFNPTTYEDEIDEDEIYDEEGRTRVKLRVENTIRWRFKPGTVDADDETIDANSALNNKESNAKVIRWSDGSMSLQVGSEYFDVYKSVILNDFNHLFVRQGTGLQGQAVFKTKLSFRPHSTNSITHRKMTLSLANRCSKAQKIKVLASVGADPETGKAEIYKKEEEKFRASIRRENQKRRMREKAAASQPSYGTNKHKSNGAGSEASLTDEDDPDHTTSISAIKNSFRKPGPNQPRDSFGGGALPPPYVTSSKYVVTKGRNSSASAGGKESRPKIYSSDSDEEVNHDSKMDSEKRSKKPMKRINDSDDE